MRIAGFEFSETAHFQKGAVRDPNAVGNHLEMLRQQRKGELTPQDVVDDARHSNSPLHSFFEWDDGAAAEAYRLVQARGLIRAVVAVYVSDDRPAVRQRAYVHVPEPGAGHYRETSHAMGLSTTREMVLRRAFAELNQWRKRYQDLHEFADLIKKIDQVEREQVKRQKEGA